MCIIQVEIGPESESDTATQLPNTEPLDTANPLWQFIFFLLLWQSIYRVSASALGVLLKFLKFSMKILGNSFSDARLQHLAEGVPSSTDAASKVLRVADNSFMKYVVCLRVIPYMS